MFEDEPSISRFGYIPTPFTCYIQDRLNVDSGDESSRVHNISNIWFDLVAEHRGLE